MGENALAELELGGFRFMTIKTDKSNSSSSHTLDSNRFLAHFECALGWHYTTLLYRTLPPDVRDALRELIGQILAPYVSRCLSSHKEFQQSKEDARASASLSIIVPVHDSPEVTKRCLMSLQKYAPMAEIILVDDASRLEVTDRILQDFAGRNSWKLIRHLQPLGHSAACGAGASLATRPYLCLLNSDTLVTPWCWRPVTTVFEDDPNVGVSGPSTSQSGTQQALPLAKLTRHYLNDSQIYEYARRLLAEPSNTILIDLPWVSGFALFIRRRLWEQIGGFDHSLPDYGNEVELCRRVLAAGYRAVWVRNSYIHHLGGVSYSRDDRRKSILACIRGAKEYIEQTNRSCDL
jgi:GT2 family glycosyltransferase